MKMLETIAISLKLSVISTIGLIINSEHPDLCVRQFDIEIHCAKKTEEAFHLADCRGFRAFISLQSVYGSTSFMNSKKDTEQNAQVNCMLQIKNLCRLNGFRTVQHTMYQLSLLQIWLP